jgi:serine/threonine protein kinase
LKILLQVASALGWVHDHGYTHMDLQSHNILVDLSVPSEPQAMLADLGLAEFSEAEWFNTGLNTGTYLW